MIPQLPSVPTSIPVRLVRTSWAIVALLTVASLIGSATSPLLLVKAPLLLVALAPDGRHVALVAGTVDPVLLLCLSVLRRSLFSLGAFGLGAAYGEHAVAWIEVRARAFGKALRAFERLFGRVGAVLLIAAPFLSLCVLAGAARTRLVVFLPALLLGHCLWASATVWFGQRVAAQSQIVIGFFSEHALESTLICVALIAAQQLLIRRKRKSFGPPAR